MSVFKTWLWSLPLTVLESSPVPGTHVAFLPVPDTQAILWTESPHPSMWSDLCTPLVFVHFPTHRVNVHVCTTDTRAAQCPARFYLEHMAVLVTCFLHIRILICSWIIYCACNCLSPQIDLYCRSQAWQESSEGRQWGPGRPRGRCGRGSGCSRLKGWGSFAIQGMKPKRVTHTPVSYTFRF